MPVDKDTFLALCKTLAKIDLFGSADPAPPWGAEGPTEAVVRTALQSASRFLPAPFQTDYVAPLAENLQRLLAQGQPDLIETLAGAVYEHGPSAGITPPLRRFLAVVSNLYRSFLSKEQRAQVQLPLIEQLPPLAMFQHDGAGGPFTIPADQVVRICGARLGVVSIPAIFKTHPILWASLAHETGGHDVLHADEGLLDELSDGVQGLFGAGPLQAGSEPTAEQFLGLLWSYWIDEAASDVYGLLNIGPTFCHNLVAFFAAMNARLTGGLTPPLLRTQSGADPRGDLDVHPTDILRIDLALGATQALTSLSTAAKKDYVASFERLAALANPEGKAIDLQGRIPVGRNAFLPFNVTVPLDAMRESARNVGEFIATAKLKSLGHHSIQEIETWDDADEAAAQGISTALQAGRSVVELGDDAQLLAGGMLALSTKPELYEAVSRAIEEALDVSYERDPIWGQVQRDPIMIVTELQPDPGAGYVTVDFAPSATRRGKPAAGPA